MQGMNAETGALLDGEAHLRQSIQRIIMTPVGTYPLQREFGSLVPYLIDKPMTDDTALQINTAIIDALYRWEPRIRTVECELQTDEVSEGQISFSLKVIWAGEQVTLDDILLS